MAETKKQGGVDLNAKVTVTQLAELLGLSGQRVRDLGREGAIPVADGSGRIPMGEAVRGYAAFLKAQRKDETAAAASARVSNARAEAIALRTARELKMLGRTDDFMSMLDQLVGLFRTTLDGWPARASRDRNTVAHLERLKDELLNEVSGKAARIARDLEALPVAAE